MSIRIDDWFVAGNAQKTNSDWNATSGFAQILNKPTNLAHTTGNETISGIKTFSSIPLSVTPASSSNDTSVATTAFVNRRISAHNNNISSHNDIRQLINDTNNNITTNIEAHNLNSAAHNDIRQLINDTNNNITTSIDNHNLNSLAHSDLRQSINDNSAAVTNLVSGLSTETSQRTEDINNLQQQIDALTSKGDVADIVGTYQDLLNYDTSTLLNKSIIKVLSDNTHDNASSYYKWSTSTSSFTYIGSEAPTYTKTEIDTLDANVVHKTGNETIGGTKTFSSVPLITGGNSAKEGGEIQLASVNNDSNYNKGIIDVNCSTATDTSTHKIRIRMASGTEGLGVYNDGTATVASPASNSNDKHVATTEWVNTRISTDTNVVHIGGTETITGSKSFTSPIVSKSGGMNISTTPSETKTNQIEFRDTNNICTGIVMSRHDTSNNIYSYLYARAHSNDTWQAIGVGYDTNNNVFTYAPKPSANNTTTNNNIATVGWVNDATTATNVVHRNGTETISGAKTFTSQINSNKSGNGMLFTNTEMDVTVAPDSTKYGGIQFNDKNGKRMGKIETYWNTSATDGYVRFGINSARYFDGTPTYSTLQLYVDDNKVTHCQLPSQIHGSYFDGTSYRAYWADLAEHYLTDMQYPKGTLVQFGGEREMTIAKNKVNAVISTDPGFILNGEMEGSQPVALIGRVPVRVIGKVKKFDKIALSYIDGVGCANNDSDDYIGIALVNKDDSDEGLVLCSIRINL